MKLSILDAIERYRQIHSAFCQGESNTEAEAKLATLRDECERSGLVFAPKVTDLYEHAEFETNTVNDDESSEFIEDEEESSEY